ncbi:D-alanyl-D-alanine carboxypeptidase family protein [Mesorhizobium sp. J428]|uniref:D-alanyl-D-alanine carboxypeptidase family protein n=1 Tax=Mesorhizobium sp. J428 TaxID=2898440 RepID=UPI002151B64C|nr:D-alanyl-D-alanine carboxypeptidase family protein [Mesorhizobium sp. J428]MCR5859334.1 D-alanyl-D-alanine carboxypeptidase [Mesorhizobium sp. J428]
MSFASAGLFSSVRKSLRPVIGLFIATTVAIAGPTAAAEAQSKKAAVVIDASTGKTLYSSSADSPRYPASLTKMMTLYLTFEAMSAGRISKDTRVVFSKYASSRPPTKLGVRPGGSITVEQAILGLVTKSANDAATALGELLGGSESNFAKMMTAKARKLGMSSTTFRNASGLPDPGQKTTARDMAILGMSLREHYPKHYSYFSTRSFAFGKSRMANHNKLLGRVQGVDGIKTGYTRASGFNLVSSVKVGDRKIVAVVMGGASGRSRDAEMERLIAAYMPKASSRGSNPLIAARTIEPQAPIVASVASPLHAKNVPAPEARPEEAVETAYARPLARPADPIADAVAKAEAPTPKVEVDQVKTASVTPSAAPKSGWVIQVGSVGSEAEARALLNKTSDKAAQLLASAEPFTERFEKGGTTYIRARFGGFSNQATAAKTCAALKKRSISCYAVQQ